MAENTGEETNPQDDLKRTSSFLLAVDSTYTTLGRYMMMMKKISVVNEKSGVSLDSSAAYNSASGRTHIVGGIVPIENGLYRPM